MKILHGKLLVEFFYFTLVLVIGLHVSIEKYINKKTTILYFTVKHVMLFYVLLVMTVFFVYEGLAHVCFIL